MSENGITAVHPDDLQRLIDLYRQSFALRIPFNYEFRQPPRRWSVPLVSGACGTFHRP